MRSQQLTSKEAMISFMFGGKATFTLVSQKTGERFTYKVKASQDRKTFFVSVMDGSCNETNYSYFGHFQGQQREFRYNYNKAKVARDELSVRGFMWFANKVFSDEDLKVDFWHEGKCCCCGRKLTVPESIESGIGPECAKRHARRFECEEA